MSKKIYVYLLTFILPLIAGDKAFSNMLTAEQIYHTVRNGRAESISLYLEQKNAINIKNSNGDTALCLAIAQEDRNTVRELISLGANRSEKCIHQFSSAELARVGLKFKSPTVSAGKHKKAPYLTSAASKTKAALALAVIGGAGALALSGGGGGGGGGNSSPQTDPEITVLEDLSTIPAVSYEKDCPTGSGMVLLNGVCACPTGKLLVEGKCIETEKNKDRIPTYFAENGASVSNNSEIELSGKEGKQVVAMQASGVSNSALKGDTVYLQHASSAMNTASGNIIMTELSRNDGGLIGVYATGGATLNNDGKINITSLSSSESAGMKVDRDDQYVGISGTGKNITNNGIISVTKSGDGTGILSAISAPGRGVTNTGTISLNLQTNSFDTNTEYGTVQGIYAKNIVNKGTLQLTPIENSSAVNANVFLTRGYGDKGSVVANDGKVLIDITNVIYGIHGVWSDKGTEVTIKNTGLIDVTGKLYKDPSISKQIYLLGSDSGISTVLNSGTIQVGTKEKPVDVSMGGIIDAIYLNSGTMTNDKNINFHLRMDKDIQSNSIFTAYAMELETGTLTNNGDIYYSFTNKDEPKQNDQGNGSGENIETEPTTKPALYLNGVEVASGTATNNKTIKAELTGYASDGFYTAMNSNGGALTNNGKIIATSDIDNLDLFGLRNTGSNTNSGSAIIDLFTSGDNADLNGSSTSISSDSVNNGYVYLTHNAGSGNIMGFSATNNGLIQIQANNMTGKSNIIGGRVSDSVTEAVTQEVSNDVSEGGITPEEGSTAELPTQQAIGKINIALSGKTAGHISGFEYRGYHSAEIPAPTHLSASTINIDADSKTRAEDLRVYGIYTETAGRTTREDSTTNTTRDGILNLNIVGSANHKTEIHGLYAQNANLTNAKTSVVNMNIDLNGSTKHFISGMTLLDSGVYWDSETDQTKIDFFGGYTAKNEGTVNIDVKGNTSTQEYFIEKHEDTLGSKVKFDVVGMLTNSFAQNTGTINLTVESDTAKTAGMVAYDGGMISNSGVIRFTGNAENFTPLYATGERYLYEEVVEEERDENDILTSKILTTTEANYYATIYNSGKIVINNVVKSSEVEPKGNGYFDTFLISKTEPEDKQEPPESYWAHDWYTKIERIYPTPELIEEHSGDTRPSFQTFNTTNGGLVLGEYYTNSSGELIASSDQITIQQETLPRDQGLEVYGVYINTSDASEKTPTGATLVRSGSLDITAKGSAENSMVVYGVYAKNANIINAKTSALNLDIDLNGSTNHLIAGMSSFDSNVYWNDTHTSSPFYGEYTAHNIGTINITVDGDTATENYIVKKHESDKNERVEFDVVGMLTNSVAINEGTINLDVKSQTAKTAGMVAYDGGLIINKGTINFWGNAENFTPMHATGERYISSTSIDIQQDEEPDKNGDISATKTTTTRNTHYYATIYNSGKIVINDDDEPSFTLSGNGYYSDTTKNISASKDAWAQNWDETTTVITEKCNEKGECQTTGTTSSENSGDNTSDFTQLPYTQESEPENVSLNSVAQNDPITLRLNDGMRYVSEKGGSFVASGLHLTGDVVGGVTLVQGNNLDTYVATGDGDGALIGDGNYSDLGLTSDSVLFNASYTQNKTNANGIDIVMTRRSFTDIVDNQSMAQFLEMNYKNGNNVSFFDHLKKFSDTHSLTTGLDKIVGKDVLSGFAFEDMSMMRELNFDMNNHLFNNKDGEINIGGQLSSSIAFKGDKGSNSRYSLSGKSKGNWSVGFGVAYTNTRSEDTDDNSRSDAMYQMIVPIGYKVAGFHLMTSPRLGYARGNYDRLGSNNTSYNGTIEKRIFGLMNEVRYPITFGTWKLEPALEFNALGYEQKGWENKKEFSLNIPKQKIYSLEGGVGFYLMHEKNLKKAGILKLTTGISAYHEFADPYALNIGINGMDGHFTIRDENRSDNRAVARIGFSLDKKDYSLYGSFLSYIDREVRSKANLGLKLKF